MSNELIVADGTAGAIAVADAGALAEQADQGGNVSRETDGRSAQQGQDSPFAEVEQTLRGEFAAIGIDADKYERVKAILKKHLTPLQHARERQVQLESERLAEDGKKRMAEIARWMGAPRGSEDHKRYWSDAAVQREYLGLIEKHGPGASQ